MRKCNVLTWMLLLSLAGHAQVRVALTGGLNNSSITPQIVYFPDTSAAVTKRTALHAGFSADINISAVRNLYLRTGVGYAARGAQFQQFFDSGTHSLYFNSVNLKVNYIDIPLQVLYKIPLKKGKKFMVGAGPQASLFYNGSMTVSSLDTTNDFNEETNQDLAVGNKDNSFKTMHMMLHAIAGFEFRKMYLSASYQRGLSDFYQNQGQGYRHASLGFTIGFYLNSVVEEPEKIKDRDGDGIPDKNDVCPDLPGPALFNGCPDKDNDGIEDKADQCPDIAGTATYQGCPVPDRDGDGLNDEQDKCPDTTGTAKYGGCPVPDTDGDSFNDEMDQCPEVAGPDNGCPQVLDSAIIEKVAYAAQQIQFKTGSAQLSNSSLSTLDSLVRLLHENPELQMTIEGHTSLEGSAVVNMKLSQQRANAVKQYLVVNGIDKARITAIGYGSTRLIYTGNDPKEIEKNRRVELKINY